ncbi:hypothetical protein IMZ48_32850 [Candidatus Bathyarchaeota archaeon]|nr:hypothetical protein [Candidatus Bathyarchaeota archaeon]
MPVTVSFEGVEPGTEAELTLLTGPEDPFGYNDPKTGVNVVKTTKTIIKAGENGFEFVMPELSVAALDTYFEKGGDDGGHGGGKCKPSPPPGHGDHEDGGEYEEGDEEGSYE